MQIVEIKVTENLERALPLIQAHYDEIARNKRVMVLKPNAEAYKFLEDKGAVLAYAAIDGAEIVGYSVSLVSPHLHYADLVYANNDVIYVAPSHRHAGVGRALIARTEEDAKARGARLVCWHAKPDTALADILRDMAYGVQDIIFSREV